jgi:dipeptidyl aminopeptidase/acylaminoacyl peptidase
MVTKWDPQPAVAGVFLVLILTSLLPPVLRAGDWDNNTPVMFPSSRSGPAFGGFCSKRGNGTGAQQRLVSETDAITMRVISGPGASSNYGGTLTRDFAIFSPDKSKFVIILKRGDLRTNTNQYSLLLYRTSELFHSPKAVVLVSMASSSNRDAIKDVSWLGDNDTILFLGEHPGERAQLYAVSCRSRIVKKLSNHPTSLLSYSVDLSGNRIVYAAEKPAANVVNEKTLRHGFRVTDETMADLIAGQIQTRELELYVLDKRARDHRLFVPDSVEGKLWGQSGEMFLSPDGRYLIVKINLTDVREAWASYPDLWVHRGVVQYRPPGALSWVFRYGIISLESGVGRVLLDSAVGYSGSDVRWAPDSQAVAISGVYLPLSAASDSRGQPAEAGTYAVEINVKTLAYSIITHDPVKLISWNKSGNGMLVEVQNAGQPEMASGRVYFQKKNGRWEAGHETISEPDVPVITTQQDLNTPPRIVAIDSVHEKKAVLLELNPAFESLRFGKVEEVSFRGADNHEIRAGLYFPPQYVRGKRYPLVIQTHGFDPGSFWIDGSFPTAFAAQALAANGMLVLQLPSSHDWVGTPEEGPKMVETFAAAIGYLEKRGVIDNSRIGIVGFSRTGFHVHFALTHSALPFAAAVVADGSDGGYSQYIQFLNESPYTASDSEALNGGLPFGSGLNLWAQRAPEFALNRVRCPVMIQALNPRSLASQWGTFAGLKRLNKPVDLLYLPTAKHILQRPWDRMASREAVIDWFTFWLLGREDPDPSKAEQYARWHQLQRLQEEVQPIVR